MVVPLPAWKITPGYRESLFYGFLGVVHDAFHLIADPLNSPSRASGPQVAHCSVPTTSIHSKVLLDIVTQNRVPRSTLNITTRLITTPCAWKMSEPLVTGVQALLKPILDETQEKLWQVHQSQLYLNGELDRLTVQLKQYLEVTETPPIRATIIKVSELSKRLRTVDSTLSTVKARLQRITETLEASAARNASTKINIMD